ncbi:camphor resistance protein CrcB [Hydrogenivirga caldilitoris]|uniref:Fluoride-specific ion channel FluC n=1 Tax=Hydrogenivirga caldilitoris TaxID=246264 RepID=A0A497XMH0_9AQUI|nr:fluoride efflux transporter CrcB [Hydrogenivirga caldilitoris]RLJ70018.1 camphor resistance protein CrcB [Hydrogenivirga caldilitoris]
MGIIISVALGGAIGSVLRFILSKLIQDRTGIDFPLGTLLVNLLGAFLIGFAFAYFVERMSLSPEVRALFITGFLGGFTTFSTFSYESYNLLMDGELVKFILYTLGTNGVGLFMTLLGYNIGRML